MDMNQYLAESYFGEGAVRLPAKVFFRHSGENHGHQVCYFVGLTVNRPPLLTHPTGDGDSMQDELWTDCEVYIVPKRKHYGKKMFGHGANGILTCGGFDPHGYTLYWPTSEMVKDKIKAARVPKTEEDDT